MYNKASKITGNINDLSNYIESNDIYNSKLLSLLSNPNLNRITYDITVNEYRPDLIAKDIYGSTDYMGLLLIQTKRTLAGYCKGTTLTILPKSTLDNIIKNL